MSVLNAIFIAVILVAAGIPSSMAAVDETALVRTALEAGSDRDAIALTAGQQAVLHEIDRIARRVGPGKSTVRRARHLHRLLQRRYLREYDAAADDLYGAATHGRYNCLSATLLYGLAARRAGFDVRVLEAPGHLLLRVETRRRPVDIETTSRLGFDLHRDRPGSGAGLEFRAEYVLSPDNRRGSTAGIYGEMPLETAVGFVWLNSAWRSLDADEPLAAAESAARAAEYLATVDESMESIRRLMTRAFRDRYERGDFESAQAIAEIEVRHLPASTSGRDRLLAAAMKRIEDACAAAAVEQAHVLIERVREFTGAGPDFERFERIATPLIAAAAVRIGAWPRALAAAERYAEIEPDPVEATRVLDWVIARQAQAEGPIESTPTRALLPTLPY